MNMTDFFFYTSEFIRVICEGVKKSVKNNVNNKIHIDLETLILRYM